jgi:hypothetical protein
MSTLAARNGGLVGVAFKWHLPDPYAVGPVLPVPAVVALAVRDEVMLFDLDNFGNEFPPALCNLFSARHERKVLPTLEDVEMVGMIMDSEVNNTIVLGHAANYACSSDVLNDVARTVLNTFLPAPLGHVGPTREFKWKEVASIAAEASLVWRTGGELVYRRVPQTKCEVCSHDHLVYRVHTYGGSIVHEVMYCPQHQRAPEGWHAVPDRAERTVRMRRGHVPSNDALRHRTAIHAFGCHTEL